MARLKKEDELLPHTRREIGERMLRANAAPKRIAYEYQVTLSYVHFIKKRFKQYLVLRKYFKDLAGD